MTFLFVDGVNPRYRETFDEHAKAFEKDGLEAGRAIEAEAEQFRKAVAVIRADTDAAANKQIAAYNRRQKTTIRNVNKQMNARMKEAHDASCLTQAQIDTINTLQAQLDDLLGASHDLRESLLKSEMDRNEIVHVSQSTIDIAAS